MKQNLEDRIDSWRAYLYRHKTIQSIDAEELEDHLRTQVKDLGEVGLDEDEAFLVAVKRIGDIDSLSREFAQEYSERLWKQLVVTDGAGGITSTANRDALVAVGLAFAAGAAIKFPVLFGYRYHLEGIDSGLSFYIRNLFLFVLPFLAGYFAWKRGLDLGNRLWLVAPFIAAALVMNLLPLRGEGDTVMLAAIHIPIALWLAVGWAYTNGRWRDHGQRMNFVRFTGEWFIYYALIALGGGVLIMFIVFVYNSIGLEAEGIIENWVLPCGIMGAVIISAWLVEAKQSVIENMAPVLTRIFTPLFTILLLAFLGTMIWTGSSINVEREALIGFDLLLILVLALVLYSISVRDPHASPGIFDSLQFLLVVCALLVDVLALLAIAARISEFGFSPNKVAALGENLILLVNLSWTAALYARFLLKRSAFSPIERWQMSYIPIYGVWAWIVVVLFPIIFGFQ
ncbi:permease prefix domain 1-containing protein [Calditrichota bacterium]